MPTRETRATPRSARLPCLALVVMAGLPACGPGVVLPPPPAPETARLPPGVALERRSYLPGASTSRGRSGTAISLLEPFDREGAMVLVRSLLEAIPSGDETAMTGVFSVLPGSDLPNVLSQWRERRKRLDYSVLLGQRIYDPEEVRLIDGSGGAIGSAIGPAPSDWPMFPQPGEALVRVPITAPQVAGKRLLADTMWLHIGRVGGRLRILAVREEPQVF